MHSWLSIIQRRNNHAREDSICLRPGEHQQHLRTSYSVDLGVELHGEFLCTNHITGRCQITSLAATSICSGSSNSVPVHTSTRNKKSIKQPEFKADLSIRAEKCALQMLRRALLVRQTSTTSNAMFSPSRSQSSHNTSHWQCRASSSKVLLRSVLSCISLQLIPLRTYIANISSK